MKTTRSEKHHVCPRCGYRLSPVHARKDMQRKPIGYCCPEPYCDYVQLERQESAAGLLSNPYGRLGRVSRAS